MPAGMIRGAIRLLEARRRRIDGLKQEDRIAKAAWASFAGLKALAFTLRHPRHKRRRCRPEPKRS